MKPDAELIHKSPWYGVKIVNCLFANHPVVLNKKGGATGLELIKLKLLSTPAALYESCFRDYHYLVVMCKWD